MIIQPCWVAWFCRKLKVINPLVRVKSCKIEKNVLIVKITSFKQGESWFMTNWGGKIRHEKASFSFFLIVFPKNQGKYFHYFLYYSSKNHFISPNKQRKTQTKRGSGEGGGGSFQENIYPCLSYFIFDLLLKSGKVELTLFLVKIWLQYKKCYIEKATLKSNS